MPDVDLSNRKLWTEKYLPSVVSPNIYNILFGSAGCFSENQLIETQSGPQSIKDICVGDMVKSFSHELGKEQFRPVLNKFVYPNHSDSLIEIKMKDGTIIQVTENHKFFFGGAYMKIKDILVSLDYERRNLEENT